HRPGFSTSLTLYSELHADAEGDAVFIHVHAPDIGEIFVPEIGVTIFDAAEDVVSQLDVAAYTGSPAQHGLPVGIDLHALACAAGGGVEQDVGRDGIAKASAQRAFETTLRVDAGIITVDAVIAELGLAAEDEVFHLPVVTAECTGDEAIGVDVNRLTGHLGAATKTPAEIQADIGASPRSNGKFRDRC